MNLIIFINFTKKNFFLVRAHAEYKRYARAKIFFFIRKYFFSVEYFRVE
jgi:hypothetical protein